ncbi:putative aminopeptidase [Tritrichomonas foetus]|uniref:Aminopeptidase n=1 Tax=Tritrichomonas foetus TaxID=1144522 RepID=A0A1J4L006_9EUKA|nr:putative aminopeptidase [Tritrichomonas foetus]|eukprot:OHT15276.1 putative aminopeptidase [Tritrichomonas foetus]
MKERAQNAIERTSNLINQFGPRLTTSEPCNKTADALFKEFENNCDHAFSKEFLTQPNGITSFLKWMSVMYYLSLAMLWLHLPQLSLVFILFSMILFIFEYILYFRIIDDLYPSKPAHNVYGVIEPTCDVKNIIIFSGHHDSAHIFNFYVDFPSLYMVREVIFVLVQLSHLACIIFLNVVKMRNGTFFEIDNELTNTYIWIRNIYTFCIIFVIPFWFYVNEKGTPGAGDNLISSSMAVELTNYYKEHKDSLKHTKLYFVSFDAEEIALRGSRAFYSVHKKEFNEVKTWNFNVDCPYFVDELKFLTSDINGLQKLSSRLVNKIVEISHNLGYKRAHPKPLMFMTGGTDAAEAARVGIEATTLLGIPFSNKDCHGRDVVYHTGKDTIDAVEPEIVVATLEIFTKFVEEVDNGNFPTK